MQTAQITPSLSIFPVMIIRPNPCHQAETRTLYCVTRRKTIVRLAFNDERHHLPTFSKHNRRSFPGMDVRVFMQDAHALKQHQVHRHRWSASDLWQTMQATGQSEFLHSRISFDVVSKWNSRFKYCPRGVRQYLTVCFPRLTSKTACVYETDNTQNA